MNETADPLARPGARSGLVAVALWAACTAAALAFVVTLATDVPYWDEWELAPYVTGQKPVTAEYLWSLHNEHRIPLPRLTYLGLFWFTTDFRSGALFNVILMSVASLMLMDAVRRVRGRLSWTDGAIPLALLHPGHAENLIASFQLQMTWSTALVCVILAAITRQRDAVGRSQALAIGGALVLLPMCGANGVVLNPVIAAWLIYTAIRRRPEAMPGMASRGLLLGIAAVALALAALYMVGYQSVPGHPKSPGIVPALISTAVFLTNTLGPASAHLWLPAIVMVAVTLISAVALLAHRWWVSPRDRPQVESFTALMAALGALALAVGVGRSGFGITAALAPRYALLAAPILCAAYMISVRFPAGWPGRWLPGLIFATYLMAYPANLSAGLELGSERHAGLEALTKDITAGVSIWDASVRNGANVYPDPSALQAWLDMLRARHYGPFSHRDAIRHFANRFPFLGGPLIQIRDGLVPPMLGWVNLQPVLVAHANSDLVFDVRPGARHASGGFGLTPDSYRGPTAATGPQHDGTWFGVVFKSDQGVETTLFSRLLRPRQRPEDQGAQTFSVTLPGDGGQLTLQARMGPPGTESDGFADWSYWQGVGIR